MTVDMGGACSCHQLPMNTYWVDHGRFLAGEYPGAPNRKEAAYKLRILLKAGISHFIDLTEPYEGLAPYAPIAAEEASRLGTPFQHSRHSIVDLDVPRSPQDAAEILDVIDEAISLNPPLWWVCGGGRVREKGLLICDDCDVHSHIRLKNRRHFLCLHHRAVRTGSQRPSIMRAWWPTRA